MSEISFKIITLNYRHAFQACAADGRPIRKDRMADHALLAHNTVTQCWLKKGQIPKEPWCPDWEKYLTERFPEMLNERIRLKEAKQIGADVKIEKKDDDSSDEHSNLCDS